MCRQIGISDAAFYTWKKKYGEMGVSELRRQEYRGLDKYANRVFTPLARVNLCMMAARRVPTVERA